MGRTAGTWDADSPQQGGYAFADGSRLSFYPYNSTPLPFLNNQGTPGGFILEIIGPITNALDLNGVNPANGISFIASFSDLVRRKILTPPPSLVAPSPPIADSGLDIPKGIRPIDVFVAYTITAGPPPTAAFARLSSVAFNPPAQSTITLDSTVIFPLAVNSGGIYPIIVPVLNPQFLTGDMSNLVAEFIITIPGAGTILSLWGIGIHYDFNFN
jgi:hypothetical protein